MIVSRGEVLKVLEDIERDTIKGFDTETYGVDFDDRMFSLIVSTPKDTYYFNFNGLPDHLGNKPNENFIHSRKELLNLLFPLFARGVWASHNAAFDVQKLRLENERIMPKELHCTLTTDRLLRNDLLDYTLEAVAKRYGMEKDMRVEEYVKKNGLYTRKLIPGKKQKATEVRYDLVPLEIMVTYGCNDAILHRRIAELQRAALGLHKRNEATSGVSGDARAWHTG